jgi:NAD(P)-dependent dehydrogenase (short-subunit alcohol dehydrogenase family)
MERAAARPRLHGRRALVTGAGAGIGRATALALAAEGAAVAVLDIRAGAATEVAADLTARGAVAMALGGIDVRAESAVEAAVARAADGLDGLDTIVACAGVTLPGRTENITLADWNLVLTINLTGVFLTLKHTLPHLCRAGNGSIVTVGSVASLVAAGRSASYDASKAGVLQLTRAVAAEYAEQGVRANCVCPGLVETDLAGHSRQIAGPDAGRPGAASPRARVTAPVARRADPAEIAAVVAFLCSAEASFLTGAAIPVDGGYTAI